MKALIIYESYFGNTQKIAESVGAGTTDRGVETTIVSVTEAPSSVDTDILILGAPTHNRHLPTDNTRKQAIADGGTAIEHGIGEWLETATLPEHIYVAAFDTSTGKSWFAGSAAKRIAKILSRREETVTAITKVFLVTGKKGPLGEGELDAARTWGKQLSADAREKAKQR